MRRALAFIILCAFGGVGCVTKAEHLRVQQGLQKEIADFRARLAAKTEETADLAGRLKGCEQLAKSLQEQLRDTKATLDRAQKNISECQGLIRGEAGKVAELSRELREKEAELHKRGLEVKRKEEELQASLVRIQLMQAQIDRLRSIFDDLQGKLQALVRAGKLTVRFWRGLLVVQLPERILFPTGSARLKAEGKEAIEGLTELLRAMKHRWQVAGHTDDVGSAAYNWQLSVRRALAVLKVMLDAGMPPEQVSAAGFGPYQPIAPNDSDENRSLNRRTELLLVPDLEELLKPIRSPARPR